MKPNPRILQIPLPGGSGLAPTGAVQFQNDWPGLFLRGDTAIYLRSAIRTLHEKLADHQDAAVRIALSELLQLGNLIEGAVIVPGHVPVLKPLK